MINFQYFNLFDEPIPYKELKIHPVRLKDFFEFATYASCLTLEKNSIKDNPELAIRAISMTYFEFLYEVSNTDNNYMQMFDALLRLILNKKNEKFEIIYGRFKEDNRPYFKIGETIYNSQDFDEIKKIISEQNVFEFPDEHTQKSVRDKIEEARKFKERINKSKIASLEEQVIALSLFYKLEIEKIFQMTYRKFVLALKRANHMIMSDLYLGASLGGNVKFKDKSVLRGWLSELDDNKNRDVTVETSEVQKRLNVPVTQ